MFGALSCHFLFKKVWNPQVKVLLAALGLLSPLLDLQSYTSNP